MGLWAWLVYSHAYLVATFVSPFCLVFWQNIYLIHGLFVIQEMADTFGFILLLIFFLLTHLLVRNSMFCVFANKELQVFNKKTVLRTSFQNKSSVQLLKILPFAYKQIISLTQAVIAKFVYLMRE